MRWSWKLGRIAGITVQVHWTFLILIAWVVAVHAARGATVGATLGGLASLLIARGVLPVSQKQWSSPCSRAWCSTS